MNTIKAKDDEKMVDKVDPLVSRRVYTLLYFFFAVINLPFIINGTACGMNWFSLGLGLGFGVYSLGD